MKRIVFYLLVTHVFCFGANAQSDIALGNWGMYFGQFRVKGNWYLHNEFQYRSYEIKPNVEQLLLRVGLIYQAKNNLYFAAGYGKILNFGMDKHLSDALLCDENRIWEQVIVRHKLSVLFFEHRLRLEQRWIKENTVNYLDRFRYLLRFNLPINSDKIQNKTIYISAYNETFLNFKKEVFDRNRLYGAVGYQISSALNFQIGYLNQYVNTKSNHYLQLAWMCNIDFNKKSGGALPILKTSDVAIN